MSLLDQKLMQGFPQAPRGMMFGGFGGQQPQIDTAPFNPGPPMVDPMPAAPSKWAAGGAGWDALSSIGNTLMTLSGNPALAAAAQQNQAQRHQMQQFDRAQAIRAQTAQQDRALDYQDWVNKQLFEREHPAPRAPHYWEMNDGSLGVVDPMTGEPRVLFKDPSPKVGYLQVDLPNGQKQLIPTINGQVMGGMPGMGAVPSGAAPTKPVGKLTPIPGGAPSAGGATFP